MNKVREYLDMVATEDAMFSMSKKDSLVEHDKVYHKGNYDPETMRCGLRDKFAKYADADIISVTCESHKLHNTHDRERIKTLRPHIDAFTKAMQKAEEDAAHLRYVVRQLSDTNAIRNTVGENVRWQKEQQIWETQCDKSHAEMQIAKRALADACRDVGCVLTPVREKTGVSSYEVRKRVPREYESEQDKKDRTERLRKLLATEEWKANAREKREIYPWTGEEIGVDIPKRIMETYGVPRGYLYQRPDHDVQFKYSPKLT